MHHQIGITANGACKVAVARRGERKVTLVARLVQRTLHAAQKERVDERRVSRAGSGINRRLQLVGISQSNARRTAIIDDAELRQRHGSTVQTVGAGVIVHAIACLDIAVGQPLGNALVSQQHCLLNKRGCAGTLARHNLYGHAVLVQQRANLGRIEVDRAACATYATPKLREFVCGDQEIGQVNVTAASSVLARKPALKRFLARGFGRSDILRSALQHRILNCAGAHQQRLGAIVVHAHARANHTGIGIVMAHTALRIELDVDGKRQAILIGSQGAQVIR